MTLRSYLVSMSLATLFCWSAWVYVLFLVDPTATNWLGFLLFYLSLFMSLAGTSAIIGFLIRFNLLKQKLVFRAVQDAFRQSFLFSFLVVAAMVLLSRTLFTWINLIFLVVALSLLEYFLISYRKKV
ncbi:hypothetical protein HGA64_04735 [Candidatus Falkowbacteria bacterium]|nr:hypothetical protein [Candidatus Falkowbacteria bacterium]